MSNGEVLLIDELEAFLQRKNLTLQKKDVRSGSAMYLVAHPNGKLVGAEAVIQVNGCRVLHIDRASNRLLFQTPKEMREAFGSKDGFFARWARKVTDDDKFDNWGEGHSPYNMSHVDDVFGITLSYTAFKPVVQLPGGKPLPWKTHDDLELILAKNSRNCRLHISMPMFLSVKGVLVLSFSLLALELESDTPVYTQDLPRVISTFDEPVDSDMNALCVKCNKNKRTTIALPCRHVDLCRECAVNIDSITCLHCKKVVEVYGYPKWIEQRLKKSFLA